MQRVPYISINLKLDEVRALLDVLAGEGEPEKGDPLHRVYRKLKRELYWATTTDVYE